MMKKIFMAGAMALVVSNSTFAGGLLTNTNQHAAFLRMLSRGATTDVDAALSNPAGLAFSPEGGFRMGFSIQSAYQTRNIDASFDVTDSYAYNKYYKGTASAPVIPSLFAAYTKDKWTVSGFFAITAGGGKASFDEGLPMFESAAMKQFSDAGLSPALYDINSAMDGRQYIYALQLGFTYKINEHLSAFLGGRMNYFSGGYKGYMNFKLKDGVKDQLAAGYALQYQAAGLSAEQAAAMGQQAANTVDETVSSKKVALDCDQTGWGFTPVIGMDAKLGRWLFGVKYEFMTSLNIENKTKENTDPEGSLAAFKHGVNTPSDIPSLLSVAARYEFLKNLRASAEYHFYNDKKAGMASDKQKYLTKGTNEWLAGIEWDINPMFTVSCGGQITDYGLSDNYQSDTSFSCDSYTLGFGGKINFSEKLALNVGYMWTTYEDYTKVSSNYNGTGMKGTNVYSRTNKVFGVSVDYKF